MLCPSLTEPFVLIAVEADPMNHAAAAANVAACRSAGGADNITLIHAAVSDRAGELLFSSEGSMGSAPISIVGGHRGRRVRVPALTLDDFVARCAVDHVDFVKFDSEGSELPVILGGGAFLRAHRPRLVIEPHFIDGRLTSAPIMSFLEALGYRCSILEKAAVAAADRGAAVAAISCGVLPRSRPRAAPSAARASP